MKMNMLNFLIAAVCCMILNSCSMHTYCPAIHHLASDCTRGTLVTGGSIGTNGINGEAIISASKNISVFGGYNSSFQMKLRDSNHVRTYADVGFAFLFNGDSTKALFAVAAGGGFGNYSASHTHHTELSGESTYDYYVSGNADYIHYYVQPYIIFRPRDNIQLGISFKTILLKYNRYYFYGTGSGNFDYDLKHVNRVIAEPAFKFETGKRLKFFTQIIFPLGIYFSSGDKVKDQERVNDWPTLTFQWGIVYSFRLAK